MQTATVNVLQDLIETLEDGRKGFAQAAERLRDDGYPEIADRMLEFSEQRAIHSAQLRDLAAGAGVTMEESGSVAGTMHRGWINIADDLTGDDPKAVLSAAEAGEDHAVSEYEDALANESVSGEVRELIERQFSEVRKAHDEVRGFRDRLS